MKSEQAILGFLAGIAIGATLGILFAPDQGSSTRKKISKKSERMAGEANDMFKELLNDFAKKYEGIKENANHTSVNV